MLDQMHVLRSWGLKMYSYGPCIHATACDLSNSKNANIIYIYILYIYILRLHDGIEKPLVVLKEKNTSLIDMQSNSLAEVQTRYEYMTLHGGRFVFHACMHARHKDMHACVRQDRDALLKAFVAVTKADCEMNLYLVRAK